jgi:hypothetical protein
MRIFISLTSAINASILLSDLTILTATVLTSTQESSCALEPSLIPTASALRTRPKHPTPICFPAFVENYIIECDEIQLRFLAMHRV